MPHIIRVRKDIIDPRPIRVYQGEKSYRYRWKMMALLTLNGDGQYVLPFSQRLVNIDRPLWARICGRAPPEYEECGCIGCENKTYADHIFKDDDDGNTSESGTLHLEEVYIASADEQNDEQNETTEDDDNNNDADHDNDSNKSAMVSSTTTDDPNAATASINGADDNNDSNYHQNNCSHDAMSISPSLSPFPCDPYESYDWEC